MKYTIAILSTYLLFVAGCVSQLAVTTPPLKNATGIVYNDGNENGTQDAWELGVPNVKVSNGTDVVATDSTGHYKLDVSDNCIVFVIKPAGWKTPLDENNLPMFYSTDKQAPINFALQRQYESDKFDVILFGDIQVGNDKEVSFFRRHLAEVIGTKAAFGISLGDNVGDNVSKLDDVNEAVAALKMPWYNVSGNHDIDLSATGDADSLETFKSIYGPVNYSFDYSDVHFIVLDSIITKKTEKGYLGYDEGLGAEQLTFIANDLKHVPKDKLVVLLMHGGLQYFPAENLHEYLGLIDRFNNTFSIAGHDHFLTHYFYDETHGFDNPTPHHYYVAGAVCGAWWLGAPNADTGTPHSMMYDGAPSGYTILSLDKNNYSLKYKAFGKPADHQMTLYAPDEVTITELATTEITANIFAASEKANVEMKIAKTAWLPMIFTTAPDPYYVDMVKWEETNNVSRYNWAKSPRQLHIWKAPLPEDLSEGIHVIEVQSTDIFGQTFNAKRLIKVTK